MNKIQQWDLQVCRVCLLHGYNRQQARVSRLISRTGDGPLYAVLAALLWWQGRQSGSWCDWRCSPSPSNCPSICC